MSKNPTTDWHHLNISKLIVTAVFSSRLPRGCKLLCKPIASFVEKNRTLTWTIGDINKSKIYLDAMFTIPTTEAIDGTTSENMKPKLTVQFQVVRKKNASSSIEDGSTNTMVTIEPAKQISVVKGTVRKKLLIKLKF